MALAGPSRTIVVEPLERPNGLTAPGTRRPAFGAGVPPGRVGRAPAQPSQLPPSAPPACTPQSVPAQAPLTQPAAAQRR